MHRRNLLKGIALGALQGIVPRGLWAAASEKKKALMRRVRPGDPRWPSQASWERLK